MPTADGRLTAQDRAQMTGELTRIRRLVTGTVAPALQRCPEEAEHWRKSLDRAELLAAMLEQLLILDEQRARREGPIDDG